MPQELRFQNLSFFSAEVILNSFMREVPIIETSPLIYRANQWTGFCMMGTSVVKVKLRKVLLYKKQGSFFFRFGLWIIQNGHVRSIMGPWALWQLDGRPMRDTFCPHQNSRYDNPALIQAVFHVGDRFWARQNRRPKN